jgi:hypothetical protein
MNAIRPSLRSSLLTLSFLSAISLPPKSSADEGKAPQQKPADRGGAAVEKIRTWLEKQRAKLRRVADKELGRRANDFYLIATLPANDSNGDLKKSEKNRNVVAPKYTVVKGKTEAEDFVVKYQMEALVDVARVLPEEQVAGELAKRPWRLVGSYSTQATADGERIGRKAKDDKVLLAMQQEEEYGRPPESLIVGVNLSLTVDH